MRALDHSRLNFSGGEGGDHFWPPVPWETGADGTDERPCVDAFVSGVSGEGRTLGAARDHTDIDRVWTPERFDREQEVERMIVRKAAPGGAARISASGRTDRGRGCTRAGQVQPRLALVDEPRGEMQKPQSLRQRSADMACARAPNIKAIETRFGAPRIANFALATDSALWRSTHGPHPDCP
jgi:hypothetical protein